MTTDSAGEKAIVCVDECPLLAVILKQLVDKARGGDLATLVKAIEDNSPSGWQLPDTDDEPFQAGEDETDFTEIGCTCPLLDEKVSELVQKIESTSLNELILRECETE